MSVDDLASQWRTIQYLESPTKVLKYLKFPPLILVPRACADNFAHAHMNFLSMVIEGVVHGVHKIVIRPSFSVIW